MKKRSAEQLSLIQERSHAADDLRKSEPEQAGAMYRAVVELYGEKPWAADAVRRARRPLRRDRPGSRKMARSKLADLRDRPGRGHGYGSPAGPRIMAALFCSPSP